MNLFNLFKKERGFTLIEVLIGLALLSVIALNSQDFATSVFENVGLIEQELDIESNIREAIYEMNRDILSADDLKILKEEEGEYIEVELGEMGEIIKLNNEEETIKYYIENNFLYRKTEGEENSLVELEDELEDDLESEIESRLEFTNFDEGDREYLELALRTDYHKFISKKHIDWYFNLVSWSFRDVLSHPEGKIFYC